MPIHPSAKTRPRVLLDGLFLSDTTGIGTVWRSIFKQLAGRSLNFDLFVLSYYKSVPKIPEIIYVEVPFPGLLGFKPDQLELLCVRLNIDLFISTYYSYPATTPSLIVIYDCIPDVFNYDRDKNTQWKQRAEAIERASSFLTISNHTTLDLLRYYPSVKRKFITSSRLGTNFQLIASERPEIRHVNTDDPFFVFTTSYKNIETFFEALHILLVRTKYKLQVVFTNVDDTFLESVRSNHPQVVVDGRRFTDEELKWLYIHCAALIYPSVYEGFGLPLLDAISCGSRVICGNNSSLPEATIGRAIVVEPLDAGNLAEAISIALEQRIDQTAFPPSHLPLHHTVGWQKFADDFLYAISLALDLAMVRI